ncbi:hypothetical protein Agub_g6676, partial [Astrephomene gubernaculifera]
MSKAHELHHHSFVSTPAGHRIRPAARQLTAGGVAAAAKLQRLLTRLQLASAAAELLRTSAALTLQRLEQELSLPLEPSQQQQQPQPQQQPSLTASSSPNLGQEVRVSAGSISAIPSPSSKHHTSSHHH